MLDLLRKSLPQTKVVAVGLLPRGEEVGERSFNRVVRPLLGPSCDAGVGVIILLRMILPPCPWKAAARVERRHVTSIIVLSRQGPASRT